MSLRNNDVVFEKIYKIIEQHQDNLINRIEEMLINENAKSYSVNYEHYSDKKYITIQWTDSHNKYNMCAVPID